MSVQNCAPGAQRETYVSKPTGFRKLTPGLIQTDRTATRFSGLPEGVTSCGQLLAAFKAAAPRLGLSARHVHAIDWLFRFTQPQDWEPGSRPIVWPSADLQEEALGLSETQVKAINRQLSEAGLITMKDSPNGKRYGRRNALQRIVEAYGFDLAPIAVRYHEFVRLAEEGRAEREAIGRLRRRATIARKGIAQILETVREYGLADDQWQDLAQDTRIIVAALRAAATPRDMEAGVASLERRHRAAKTQLESALGVVDSDPKGAEDRPHIQITNESENPNKDTVMAHRACSSATEPPVPRNRPAEIGPEVRASDAKIAPEELIRLAPRLKPYLRTPTPDWRDILDASEWLRHDLDISKSLWGEACQTLGRELAAVALAIVSTKPEGYFQRGAGGYYHAMIGRAKTGQLNLDRSVWALRRASDPDRRARSGAGA